MVFPKSVVRERQVIATMRANPSGITAITICKQINNNNKLLTIQDHQLFTIIESLGRKVHKIKSKQKYKLVKTRIVKIPKPLYMRRPIPVDGQVFKQLGCCSKPKNYSKQFQMSSEPRPKVWQGNAYVVHEEGFRCVHCSLVKDSKSKIQQHCKNHYEPEYKCEVCQSSWNLKSGYMNHFKFQCLYCKGIIRGKSGCLNHVKSHSCQDSKCH